MSGEGPLAKLLTALINGASAQKKLERAVGEEFYRAADDVPDMFRRGRRYGQSRADLENQFGVQFRDYPGSTSVTVPGAAGKASMDYVMSPGPSDTATFPRYRPRVMFDTSMLAPPGTSSGAGAGRGAYAAMFGTLLENPELVNMVDSTGLTRRNEHRRNLNQAAALLRAPELSRQIALDPFQFAHQRRVDPEQFMRRSPVEQVGALQAEGALQTIRRMDETAHAAKGKAGGEEFAAKLQEARRRAFRSSDPADFSVLATLLREGESLGIPKSLYDTIGEGALRRAALVSDIVDGRPGARANLYSGLEFARGGGVRNGRGFFRR